MVVKNKEGLHNSLPCSFVVLALVRNRKFFKGYCVLCCMLKERIVVFLRESGAPCTQKEIAQSLPSINRAVLLGYLRCLVDVGRVKSKNIGKAKSYYL